MAELSDYRSFIPVVSARAVNDHEVAVTFKNGQRAIVDFTEIIGQGPWSRLADASFFALAHAAYDTVIWTEDIDVAPEYVWEKASPYLEQSTCTN